MQILQDKVDEAEEQLEDRQREKQPE